MINGNFMFCIHLIHLDYSTIDYKNRAKSNLLTHITRKSEPILSLAQFQKEQNQQLSILRILIVIVDTLETEFLKKGYSNNCQIQYI
jgi:hypothetical protein